MLTKENLVALLKAYCARGEITRTEAGQLLGDFNRNQMARLCDDHDIKPWPRIPIQTIRKRKCQQPVEVPKPGQDPLRASPFCGHDRAPGDPLRCYAHRGKTGVCEKV